MEGEHFQALIRHLRDVNGLLRPLLEYELVVDRHSMPEGRLDEEPYRSQRADALVPVLVELLSGRMRLLRGPWLR